MDVSNSIIENYTYRTNKGIEFSFDVKRDDLIDEVVSGNKWRKLAFNILKAKELHKSGILTFGGAYSNHLVATAKAAQNEGIKTIGIVRGEELNAESNATLRACSDYGMELHFVSREEYRLKNLPFYIEDLAIKFPNYRIVPEGGMNYYGMIGCQKILQETKNDYQHVYLAGGTGTTAAGILLSASEKTKIHLVSALKGDFLTENIRNLLNGFFFSTETTEEYLQQLSISENDFGKYGNVTDELIDFINEVYAKIRLKLDPVYTAKAFFKMVQDVDNGQIKKGERLLFIHTGGLQGAEAWKNRLNYFS